MPVVGTLTVDLVANTATFTADLGKAGNSLDGFGKQAQGAGDAMDFSMREARGSLMLVEHEIGVRLPREMNTLIAQIPGIGAAMQALLPIMGAVFAAKMIYDFVEKSKAAQEALTEGWAKSAESIATHSDELGVSIAQSKLKIDELLGKPTSGDELALEIAKAKVEADKLAASLKKDLDGVIALLDKSAHGGIMTAILGTSGTGQAEDVAKGLRDALAKIPRDAKDYNEQAAAATVAAWQRAQSEIAKNNAAAKSQQAQLEDNPEAGGAYVTDYTAANTALQEFQQHLSDVHNELDLVGKDDAFKKQAKDVGDAVAAEDAAFDATNRHQLEMDGWKLKKIKDQQDIAKAVEENERGEAAIREECAKAGVRSIDALIAEKQKEVDEWVKFSEKMIEEDKRHALVMAELRAKDSPEHSKNAENRRYHEQVAAYEKERALLITTGQQRIADEQKIDHKEEEEKQKHENALNRITQQGEQKRADLVKQFASMTLFENKSVAAAIEQIGKQMLQTMIDQTLQALMVKEDANAREKLGDAKTAAANTWNAVSAIPVVGPFLAPPMAAAAFAGVMAFETGGEIPGSGPVPIIGHGGETVVTKQLTDQVKNNTGSGGKHNITYSPTIHALDADGVKRTLDKHSALFTQHFTNTLRKMNRI